MLKKKVALILKNYFDSYLKENNCDTNVAIEIGYPSDEKFGDYACAASLRLAKELKKNPMDIANAVVKNIKSDMFEKVEVVAPGFINITLSDKYLSECVEEILKNDKYGKDSVQEKLKILLEYVSANPTGPLHIGHGRWAAIGSALKNLLKYVGHSVDSEFYVNDAGEQIEKLNRSVQAVKKGEEVPEDGYHGEYIKDIAKLDGVAKDIILESQKELLKKFKTDMDNYASELEIRESGELEKALESLHEKGLLYEKEDALWFKSTDYADDKDRVVKKTSGDYTYFAPDIAYHKTKIDRGYNYLIDILGADHHGYVSRITAAVRALSNDKTKLHVILGQLVRLYRGKELVRMSKRTGDMITLEEVIEEIGVDSTRYFLLMRGAATAIDFDLELAKKKDNDNPVYYVQYAYARICNIFFKLEEKSLNFDDKSNFDISKIKNDDTRKLAKMIIRLPDELSDAAKSFEVYPVINYLYDVASAFHRFYYENIVLSDDEVVRNERLKLSLAVKNILAICFDIIGITKIERMWTEDKNN